MKGIVNMMYVYRRSWLILAVIALKFYIMNLPGFLSPGEVREIYRNGTALCWIIFSLSVFVRCPERLAAVACTFCMLMVYTLADNVFFGLKETTVADGYFIGSLLLAGVLAFFYQGAPSALGTRTKINIGLLVVLGATLIGGRNYVAIFDALNITYVANGQVWYLSDAIAFVLAATYTLYNSRSYNIISALLFLLLAVHNLLNDAFLDPVHTYASEWAIIIYIGLFIVWLFFRYRYRKSVTAVRRLVTIAVSFHAYLVAGILSAFIFVSGDRMRAVKLASVFILLASTTWILSATLWRKKRTA